MLEQELTNMLESSEPMVPRGRGAESWTERVAAGDEWERRYEAEWLRIDQKLRTVAARRAALDAEEARLLRYGEELKLWRAGLWGMIEYMERVMGYAPHTASEWLRVARALAELPLIEEALEHGELAHSAVRELSRVAVPETEAVWLEASQGKCLPGCRRNVGLDLHHIEYQSHGGGHGLNNLTTLCDLHRRAVHFKKLAVCGVAPDRLTFEFRKPRDRRKVTDDDEPARADLMPMRVRADLVPVRHSGVGVSSH